MFLANLRTYKGDVHPRCDGSYRIASHTARHLLHKQSVPCARFTSPTGLSSLKNCLFFLSTGLSLLLVDPPPPIMLPSHALGLWGDPPPPYLLPLPPLPVLYLYIHFFGFLLPTHRLHASYHASWFLLVCPRLRNPNTTSLLALTHHAPTNGRTNGRTDGWTYGPWAVRET